MPRLFGTDFTRGEVMRRFGAADQVFGVRLAELSDGPERGVRMLQFRTGSGFEFDVLVDRCMDIGSMRQGAASIGWHSPTGFRSPWLHEVDAEGGLGFLRSFSGFMNTCGLDHVMGMAEESAEHYNYRFRDRITHGIHGRSAFTPARLCGYGARWDGDECVLWAEGEVRQVAMFAENLALARRIEARVGTSTVTVTDRVENRGYYDTPHMLLYHVNIGWPVLSQGSELRAPIERIAYTAHTPGVSDIGYRTQAGPQTRFPEQAYQHLVKAGPDGRTLAGLFNRDFEWPTGGFGLGFLMEYSPQALPALWQWQNLQEGNYVIGIEPCTIHAGTRDEQRERGDMIWLAPGADRDYLLTFSALAGEAALAEADARIDAIGPQPKNEFPPVG